MGQQPLAIDTATGTLGGIAADVYNWRALRRLQRAIAAAIAGSGFCDILIIGDSHVSSLASLTPSADPVNNFPAMWPRKLRTLLAARGIPIAGGWIFANDTTGANDDRWTFSGPWIDGYGTRTTNSAGTVTATCYFDTPGTTVAIAYLDAAFIAPFDVSIDGGAATRITPSDGSGKVSIQYFTSLSDIAHTATITSTATTNNPAFLLAAACYRSSGVRILNAAQQGAQATADWSATPFGDYTRRAYATKAILPDPDLLLINIGLNDWAQGQRTSPQLIADLTYIRGKFPTSDVMLFADNQPPGAAYSAWPTHVAALYKLADTLPAPLFDLNKLMGGPTAATTNGLYGKDGLHYTILGEALIAALVTDGVTRRQ